MMKDKAQESWKRKFDEQFVCTEVTYEKDGVTDIDNTGGLLKSFIRSLLATQLEEVRKKIKNLQEKSALPGCDCTACERASKVYSDILSNLQDK